MSPAPIMIRPASAVRTKSPSVRSSAGSAESAEPAASAAALVVVITIRRVLAVSPPPTGPAIVA